MYTVPIKDKNVGVLYKNLSKDQEDVIYNDKLRVVLSKTAESIIDAQKIF